LKAVFRCRDSKRRLQLHWMEVFQHEYRCKVLIWNGFRAVESPGKDVVRQRGTTNAEPPLPDAEHTRLACPVAGASLIVMAATYSAQGFGSGGPSPFVSQTARVPAPAPAAAPQPAIWNPAASTAVPTAAAPHPAPAGSGVHPPQTAQFDAPWGSALAGAFAGGQSTDAQS
jgi:hypothetical protein